MPLRFAVDTGGTFTDLVVEGSGPLLRFYKRPTTPADPVEGLLDVLAAAAADHGSRCESCSARGDLLVFGTTRATNAVVTGTTARTALLCTQGHPDVLLFREGGGRTTLFDYTQEYPAPYVPRSLTFEMPERILADGTRRVPLDEDAVRAVCRRRCSERERRGGRRLPALVDRQPGARAARRRAPRRASARACRSRSRTRSTRACASTAARPRPRSTRRSSR